MKDSLKIKDELSIENGILNVKHTSARMIGEVTIEEVDPLGNVVFSSTNYNDITIGGATFILEQMFKKASGNSRFNLTGFNDKQWESNITDSYIIEEKILGFMIGIGGEDGLSVKAPNFTATRLDQFIPFRTYTPDNPISDSDKSSYFLSSSITLNGTNYTGLYAKKFNEIDIVPEYADGSGVVTVDNMAITDSPIYTYAKLVMDIDTVDVREYFRAADGTISNCRVNQLGLIAGRQLSGDVYDDMKLVTIVNFKGRDLSNDENTLKMRYKIYCM